MKIYVKASKYKLPSNDKIQDVIDRLIGDSEIEHYSQLDKQSNKKNTLRLTFGRPLEDDDYNYDENGNLTEYYPWLKPGRVQTVTNILKSNINKNPDIKENILKLGGYIWNQGRGDTDVCGYVIMPLDYFYEED